PRRATRAPKPCLTGEKASPCGSRSASRAGAWTLCCAARRRARCGGRMAARSAWRTSRASSRWAPSAASRLAEPRRDRAGRRFAAHDELRRALDVAEDTDRVHVHDDDLRARVDGLRLVVAELVDRAAARVEADLDAHVRAQVVLRAHVDRRRARGHVERRAAELRAAERARP